MSPDPYRTKSCIYRPIIYNDKCKAGSMYIKANHPVSVLLGCNMGHTAGGLKHCRTHTCISIPRLYPQVWFITTVFSGTPRQTHHGIPLHRGPILQVKPAVLVTIAPSSEFLLLPNTHQKPLLHSNKLLLVVWLTGAARCRWEHGAWSREKEGCERLLQRRHRLIVARR